MSIWKLSSTDSELLKPEHDVSFIRFPATVKGAHQFAQNFAFGGLLKVIEDFGIGNYEAGQVIEWFWKASRLWAPQASQAAFNSYARARIDDHVRYSRRRGDAFHLIDALFDKARFNQLNFSEVIDAIAFLAPTKPLPEGRVTEVGDVTLIDLTLRKDSPKILRVDSAFFPTLKRLYPFRRVDDVILKDLPAGTTTTREFKLVYFAWWVAHPGMTYDITECGLGFSDDDSLNWTQGNLFDIAAERLRTRDAGVPGELPEYRSSDGKRVWVPGRPQPAFEV